MAASREAGGWNPAGECDYRCNEVGEGIQDLWRTPLVCAGVVRLREGKGSEEERPVDWASGLGAGEQPGSPSCGAKEEEFTGISSGFAIGSWCWGLCAQGRKAGGRRSLTENGKRMAATANLGGRTSGWLCAYLRLIQVITTLSFLPLRFFLPHYVLYGPVVPVGD